MKTIIIGYGEIGKALDEVLSKEYEVGIIDPIKGITTDFENCDILHIAFPYSENFIDEVKKYKQLFRPTYTVIHSTVKPGTSRELDAIHSAVIGIHPRLTESLYTFTKFLAGPEASGVADYFRRAGINVYLFDKPETSELLKILDTTFYGLCVEYTKHVKHQTERFEVPFEAWTIWTDNYNRGYEKLGHKEFTRPNLTPIVKKIGGHCVLPNCELLDSKFTDFIKELNV